MTARWAKELLNETPEYIGKEYLKVEAAIDGITDVLRDLRFRDDYRPLMQVEYEDLMGAVHVLRVVIENMKEKP